jgi:5-oxoprolinase (ATP-hydrolysing)
MEKKLAKKFKFAIDRGGTFTDIVCHVIEPGFQNKTIIHKLLSVNPNYKDAPLEGIRQIISKETGTSPSELDPVPSE